MSSEGVQNHGLNPEPTDPEEREWLELPPKSYADAAHKATEPGSTGNTEGKQKTTNGNNDHDQPMTNSQTNGEGSSRQNFHDTNVGKKLEEEKVVFEKYSNGDGSYLTSVKPDPDWEESLKHNVETAPKSREPSSSSRKYNTRTEDTPKPQLKSGRKAGAGWGQSA